MKKHDIAWQLWKEFSSIPENKRDLAKMSKEQEATFMTAYLIGIQNAMRAIESGELKVLR
jgi:hypothetical protein